MGFDYGWEKTTVAVTGMASSPDSINERIAIAYRDSLMRIRPEEHLPENLHPLFAEIKAAFATASAIGGEGDVVASARAMSTEQATEVARNIVSLYDQVCAAVP